MVQAVAGCMALACGRERRKGIQSGFERRNAARSGRDCERSLVCGQAVCPAGRHSQSGAPRSSPHLCPDSATTQAANSNRSDFCLATLQSRQRSDTSEANRNSWMRLMIVLEFRSRATPTKPAARATAPRLTIASFIIHYLSWQTARVLCVPLVSPSSRRLGEFAGNTSANAFGLMSESPTTRPLQLCKFTDSDDA